MHGPNKKHKRKTRSSTLPPITMEVENGVLEDGFSLQMGKFSTSMIMGGRVNLEQGSLYYQPKQCTIQVKSLKIVIDLHCLIPTKWVPFNDPCRIKWLKEQISSSHLNDPEP